MCCPPVHQRCLPVHVTPAVQGLPDVEAWCPSVQCPPVHDGVLSSTGPLCTMVTPRTVYMRALWCTYVGTHLFTIVGDMYTI